MSIYIHPSASGDGLHFAVGNWATIIRLAQEWGWEPPQRADWTTNDGWDVSASDAAKFVAALTAALPTLPDIGKVNRHRVAELIGVCQGGFFIE